VDTPSQRGFDKAYLTEEEVLMGGSWEDPGLHHRQSLDDGVVTREGILHNAFYGETHVTADPVGPGRTWRRWRILAFPFLLILLGVTLVIYSPLPGLGVLLVCGAAISVPVIILRIWLG
jgi:hypothetical protein